MELIIHGDKIKVTSAMKSYLEEKLEKLEKIQKLMRIQKLLSLAFRAKTISH